MEPPKLRKMFPEGVKTIQGPLFYEETPSEYAVHLSRQIHQFVEEKIKKIRLESEDKYNISFNTKIKAQAS